MSSAAEFVVLIFAITNGLRVVAYLPQIARLARDDSGAAAVSCSTWILFLLSNVSTVAYAALVLGDAWMTLAFAGNAMCNLVIVILTLIGRRRASRGPFRKSSERDCASL